MSSVHDPQLPFEEIAIAQKSQLLDEPPAEVNVQCP